MLRQTVPNMGSLKHSELSNKTSILLPIGSCLFLDFPDNHEDCVAHGNSSTCYYCRFLGKFLSGETINDFNGSGHILTLVTFGITIVLGLFGTLANLLIIAILKRRTNKKAFDTFLITLAIYDIICSIFPVLAVGSAAIYFGM